MNNCVAINIISNGQILNNKGIPILFYWDGKSDVKDEIIKFDTFKKFLNDTVMNKNHYTTGVIAYWYFKEDKNDNWKEVYNENRIAVQELFPLSVFNTNDLAFSFVLPIVEELYRKAFNTDYARTSNSIETTIKNIYSLIKNKYGDKLNKTTYVEYVRTELAKLPSRLSQNNVDFILQTLTNTF